MIILICSLWSDGSRYSVPQVCQVLQSETSILGECVLKVSTAYFNNIRSHLADRINVKLGGINLIPDTASAAILTDPANPTIVMGMLVILCS